MDQPKDSLPCEAEMPYEAGKNLTLETESETLIVHIIRVVRPSTLSCVMLVESVKERASPMILKLYDWRYATELRTDHKVDPWDQSHEDVYRSFVENGDAAKFIMALNDDDDDDDDRLWDTARNEAYLFDFCRNQHRSEVNAYTHLTDLQGKSVPRFYASVDMNAFPTTTKDPLFSVSGILVEFIDGHSLSELQLNEPDESRWQSICDEAVRTINLIGDYGVLNEDVKPHNMLVRKKTTSTTPQVFVIDFGQCRFREAYAPDAQWLHEKSVQDEEGAIGYVMAHRLKGKIKYEPSKRYRCPCSYCTLPDQRECPLYRR